MLERPQRAAIPIAAQEQEMLAYRQTPPCLVERVADDLPAATGRDLDERNDA